MKEDRRKRYARLLVDTALAVQPGQYLYIEASLEAETFVAMVTRAALNRGGSGCPGSLDEHSGRPGTYGK